MNITKTFVCALFMIGFASTAYCRPIAGSLEMGEAQTTATVGESIGFRFVVVPAAKLKNSLQSATLTINNKAMGFYDFAPSVFSYAWVLPWIATPGRSVFALDWVGGEGEDVKYGQITWEVYASYPPPSIQIVPPSNAVWTGSVWRVSISR